jgi:hypothetical protein
MADDADHILIVEEGARAARRVVDFVRSLGMSAL